MKHLKTLILVATALMAAASPASATILTSPPGTTYTGAVHMTSSHIVFHGSFISITCKSSGIGSSIQNHGAGVTAGGGIGGIYFTSCNYPVNVLKAGSLEFHAGSPTGNGTLTWSGAEIELQTSIGQCIITTSGTDIGTLTFGNPATVDLDSPSIPRTGGTGGFFCGSSVEMTGNYGAWTPVGGIAVH